MQKARRHPTKGLRPLVGVRFQVLFHPLIQGTFHLSLTVLFAISLCAVFSLTGWYRLIQTGFLWSRPTQDPRHHPNLAFTRLSRSVAPLSKGFNFVLGELCRSYNPRLAVTSLVWALPLSLATTGGITCLFSFPPLT
jgi:hypothetical protein